MVRDDRQRRSRREVGTMVREDLLRDDLLRDDRVWERVWERMLGPVERHAIAMAVWRRRVPPEPFEARIARELARRWRRQALSHALLYLLWSVFWGAIALHDWRPDASFESLLTPVCTLVGALAIGTCFAIRRRLRPLVAG